jgi:hypothetical protein
VGNRVSNGVGNGGVGGYGTTLADAFDGDRGEIAPILGTAGAYRSILRPSSSTNLPGRIAALKATKTRLNQEAGQVGARASFDSGANQSA